MIGLILIIGIIAIIIYAIFDSGNHALKNGQLVEGKYAELVKELQGTKTPQVFQSTSNVYSFGWVTSNADNRFQISQKVNHINVTWTFKAQIKWAKHKINLGGNWNFPDNTNTEEIVNKIQKHVTESYQNA